MTYDDNSTEGDYYMDGDEIREAEEYTNRIESQLSAANARIAELERCCVMGGDGKPIDRGEVKYFIDAFGNMTSASVTGEFRTEECGKVAVRLASGIFSYWMRCSDLYSSPESVPEGVKE